MTVYGCHNRPPMRPSHVGQDGYQVVRDGFDQPVAMPVFIDIPHRMTTDCQHPSGEDPRCAGCRWRDLS